MELTDFSNEFSVKEGQTKSVCLRQIHGKETCPCAPEATSAGLAVGMAAGTCLGIRMKTREKQIRRGINRAARSVENAFDTMTR